MQRLGLINIVIGFSLLFLAACGGAFIAVDTTQRILEGTSTQTWRELLQTSSHGHTSLFGLIHIAFGLTLPYSKLSELWKRFQTLGLSSGALAMGPGMIIRSAFGPSSSFEWNGLVLGALLSLALAAIGLHIYGLICRLELRR